jgi:CheY-like chemotaxis protein
MNEIETRAEGTTQATRSDRLLLRMNHEIRTAVNAILGLTELLLDSPLTPEQAYHVNVARASADHLLTESAEILDLARAELGSLQLQRVIAMVRNGIERMGKGEISISVKHDPASGQGVMIECSVADSGPRIPPAVVRQIFNGALDLEATTRKDSGLALTLAKHLVELMGGTIWIDDGPGPGTVFHFNVNLALAHPAEPAPGDHKTAAEARNGERPLRILVAEDATDNLLLIRAFLKDEPWKIDSASNGRIALEKALTASYDLILMDLDMPEMDGYTAARKIRSSECSNQMPAVPIVALTAHNEADAVLRSIEAGCTAHVTKPIHKASFLKTVRQYAMRRS